MMWKEESDINKMEFWMDNLWKIGMFKYHFCIGIEEFEQAPIFREMWLTTLINVCNIVNRVLDFFLIYDFNWCCFESVFVDLVMKLAVCYLFLCL